jgi:hypothetical protein
LGDSGPISGRFSRRFKEIQGDSRRFKEIQGDSRRFKEIQGDSRRFKESFIVKFSIHQA